MSLPAVLGDTLREDVDENIPVADPRALLLCALAELYPSG